MDHRLSSLSKPRDAKQCDPGDGFFYPHLTLLMDSYSMPRSMKK